ncbi:MAG: hypothetical protein AAF564_07070 [Bacteroidota bacterium]
MEIQRSRFIDFSRTALAIGIMCAFMACEDPTNVGLGLVGDDSGQPLTESLDLDGFMPVDEVGIVDNLGEVLAGRVEDPSLGTTQAVAYFDVRTNTNQTIEYRNGPVERAILELETSYVYGDTLSELTFALHEVLNEFTGFQSTVDSIPPVGPELLQFSMMPKDAVVAIELPATWVAQYDADLRTPDFGQAFAGFQLRHIEGNAVVGFHNIVTRDTRIRSIVGTDTVNFVAEKSITTLEKETEGTLPPGRVGIQDGIGPKISFSFPVDSLQGVALNRAAIQLSSDNEALDTPTNFFRPTIDNLALHGVLNDSSSALLAIGTLSDDGDYRFVSETFHTVLQSFLLGGTPYESYEIRFSSTSANSIDAVVLHNNESETDTPHVFITYTDLQ